MNRTEKASFVEAFHERVAKASLVVLADFRGMTVPEVNAFRRSLAAAGVGYQVVKNTLAKRAIQGTPLEGLAQWLTGMTGWVIAGEDGDPVGAAKVLRDATNDFRKEQRFIVKGGYFDGESLDAEAIEKVADLQSREELLAQLLATIQEPARQVLGVIQGPARDLVYLLKNYEQKLSEEGA